MALTTQSSNSNLRQEDVRKSGVTSVLPVGYPVDLYAPAGSEYEIRPAQRRVPDQLSMVIEMVDRDYQRKAIVLDNELAITTLKLAPNPNTLTISSSKIINKYNTMTRWVEEHWGDEIDSVTFSGSTFSFMAVNIDGVPDVGLTVKYRDRTPAYRSLKELLKFYRINGCIYQDERFYEGTSTAGYKSFIEGDKEFFEARHPRRGLIKERLYIRIIYDYVTLLGYFESFDVIEDSSSPYRFTYNAIFKSEKTVYNQGSNATAIVAQDTTSRSSIRDDSALNTNSLEGVGNPFANPFV